MSTTEAAWLALGTLGQLLFTGRALWQWLASERAGLVVVPRGYWRVSLIASALVAIYAVRLGDPVFLAGPVMSLFVCSRNVNLEQHHRADPASPPHITSGLLAAASFLVVLALIAAANRQTSAATPAAWLCLCLSGYVLWSLRSVVQWWHAERVGKAVLPTSYFALGLIGSTLLLLYALVRRDPVFVAAYALTPLPYLRNLLIGRSPDTAGPAKSGAAQQTSRPT